MRAQFESFKADVDRHFAMLDLAVSSVAEAAATALPTAKRRQRAIAFLRKRLREDAYTGRSHLSARELATRAMFHLRNREQIDHVVQPCETQFVAEPMPEYSGVESAMSEFLFSEACSPPENFTSMEGASGTLVMDYISHLVWKNTAIFERVHRDPAFHKIHDVFERRLRRVFAPLKNLNPGESLGGLRDPQAWMAYLMGHQTVVGRKGHRGIRALAYDVRRSFYGRKNKQRGGVQANGGSELIAGNATLGGLRRNTERSADADTDELPDKRAFSAEDLAQASAFWDVLLRESVVTPRAAAVLLAALRVGFPDALPSVREIADDLGFERPPSWMNATRNKTLDAFRSELVKLPEPVQLAVIHIAASGVALHGVGGSDGD